MKMMLQVSDYFEPCIFKFHAMLNAVYVQQETRQN